MPPVRLLAALSLVLGSLFAASPATGAGAPALAPFSLPWNDVSGGVTNFASWQAPIATTASRLGIDADAHYQLDGRRVRLLGVNIGADAAFPSHGQADAHAARLARFGFNAVRLHHMEAPWAPNSVIIDYATGSSRNLSADRLDKLHYFVSRLAANGIYSDVNLLVSREFKSTDGLGSEITQLSWKDQHILGFFHEGALALHKEHATKLLSAANPYRGGLSLAQDPAVAVVEIMNENGLLQKWYEGVVDMLPSTYALALRAKWNTWLHAKYADSAALLAGWGAVDQPLGLEVLANANFTSGTTSWVLEQHNGAAATASVTNDFSGQPSARIAITTPATTGWHLQFNQPGLTLVQGQVYTVSFWAKSSVAGSSVSVGLSRAHDDYAGLSSYLTASLGTVWKQYSFAFQCGVNESNARLNVTDFGGAATTLWLAGMSLKPGGKLGGLPDGATLEASNVPNTLRNPTGAAPSLAQRRDWINFCLGLERTYWDTMKAHVKSTLGFQGIVWGTIISNSPPNAQAGLDAMDSHSYWQHPTWPAGHDWDPVLWTIPNVSMVNSPASSTVAGMSLQRVKGYPHNVTEYQHPSPNSYSAESPLLSASIGALQDWDGLWFFDYATGTADYVTGFFDQSGHPAKMANSLLAAALFRRGDVGVARREYTLAQTPATETESALTRGGAWSIADGAQLGMPGALSCLSRVSLSVGAGATGLLTVPTAPAGPEYPSDTGQLRWDTTVAGRGVFTVDTPLTKALVGFADGRSFDLSGVTLSPGTTRLGWCTLGLVLTEGSGFAHPSGGRILVVATGDLENTGQVWKDTTHTSVGSNWGDSPVLVERIQAEVVLPVPAARVSAWALDVRGQRATALSVTERAGRAVLQLGQSGTTLWYEIVVAPAAAAVAPAFTAEPLGGAYAPGSRVVLTAAADGHPSPGCQWYRGGLPLAGETSPVLVLSSLSAAQEGDYTVVATNSAGAATSRAAGVRLLATAQADAGMLVNVSTRADVGTGFDRMVMGFYTEGTRELLLRAVGPKLNSSYGVPGVLPDPMFELDRMGASTVATNDDWNAADPALEAAATLTGAFSLLGSPKESCLLSSLPAAGYTITVHGAHEETGNCLVEGYDTGRTTGGRLINVSTRALVGSDANSVAIGFSVSGHAPRRFLIRGIGPGLTLHGVPTAVEDPVLVLYDVSHNVVRRIASNDDWEDYGQGAVLNGVFSSTGAFPLSAMSRDAALVLWLEPGLYSAIISSKSGKAVGLVEVYEVR